MCCDSLEFDFRLHSGTLDFLFFAVLVNYLSLLFVSCLVPQIIDILRRMFSTRQDVVGWSNSSLSMGLMGAEKTESPSYPFRRFLTRKQDFDSISFKSDPTTASWSIDIVLSTWFSRVSCILLLHRTDDGGVNETLQDELCMKFVAEKVSGDSIGRSSRTTIFLGASESNFTCKFNLFGRRINIYNWWHTVISYCSEAVEYRVDMILRCKIYDNVKKVIAVFWLFCCCSFSGIFATKSGSFHVIECDAP